MIEIILFFYFAVLVSLALFGLHRYLMVYLYYKHRNNQPRSTGPPGVFPSVTVQLPIYNEMYVVERLIDAVARLDYPASKLEIQILDDSTDETRDLARRRAEFYRHRGVDIQYIHREDRKGFKAGALANGLKQSRGELVAVFDADFLPSPAFLKQTVSHFARSDVGMVQVRWGHINRGYSLLTRAQSILLDGHFILEHGARNRSGRFFNFNGTAGVWRRRAIEDSGGWQHDTLTEDLDLSYRAQLRGWKFIFLPEAVSPAEIPVEMNAFKSQQHRWAKGSIQTAKKLLPRLLASRVPLRVKLEAVFHLTANLAYPLMVVLSALMFPSIFLRHNMGWHDMLLIDLALFVAGTASVTSFYAVSQKEIQQDWRRELVYIPFLMSLGIGISLNNALAVIEALAGRETRFVRTPKYRIESDTDAWSVKRYRGKVGYLPWVELIFGAYLTGAVVYAVAFQILGAIPFLVLFQVGFLYTAFMSLFQGRAWGSFSAAASRANS